MARILMTAFCPDCLALLKLDRENSLSNSYCLFPLGANVHFHTACLGVESCFMLELPQVKVAVQFAIDARQQIQIKSSRDPKRVIVGRDQLRDRLLQIGS